MKGVRPMIIRAIDLLAVTAAAPIATVAMAALAA
jgi:hypothetical protein